MIKKIRLQNWKSFEDAELSIDPLTVLIGTNGSGKSNALEALLLVSLLVQGKDIKETISKDTKSKSVRGDNDTFNRKTEITIHFSSSEDEYTFYFKIEVGPFGAAQISEEYLSVVCNDAKDTPHKIYEKKRSDSENNRFFNTVVYSNNKAFQQLDGGSNQQLVFFRLHISILDEKIKHHLDTLFQNLSNINFADAEPNTIWGYHSIEDKLNNNASNLIGYLANFENKKGIEKIITDNLNKLPENRIKRVWVEAVGRNKSDVTLYCSEIWGEKEKESEKTFDARVLSEGTLRLIYLTAILNLIPEYTTIVIEDIEKYFHSSKAHLIMDMIKNAIKERHIDVIISTHSPAFLDEIKGRLLQNVSVVYRNDKTGYSEIKKYTDFDDYVRFISKGSLGDVATQGLIEQSVHKSATNG